MPTPTVETDHRQPGLTEGTCGHRWVGLRACDLGPEHGCSRTSPEHRSHLCTCQAVELRTATHLPLDASRPLLPSAWLDATR